MSPLVGRPRDNDLDDAILDATAELITEHGYLHVSVRQIAKQAGTTRAAFYRRYRDLADVVGAILARRYGLDDDIDTGTLPGDLLLIQQRQAVLFRDRLVQHGLVGFLEATHQDTGRGDAFLREFLLPRRAVVRIMLERAQARGETPAVGDSEWICDLITGPLLTRALLPGLPPIDDHLIDDTIRAALHAVGYDRVPGQSSRHAGDR